MAFLKRLAIAIAIFFGLMILTGFVSGVLKAAVGQDAKDIAIVLGSLTAVVAGILYLVKPGLFRPFAPAGARAFFKRLAGAVALFIGIVILVALLAGILGPLAGRTAYEAIAVVGVLAAVAAGLYHLIKPGLRAGG